MTEQALRAAETDVCRRKLEMIRASEAEIEARAERRRLRWLELEAQQARELERGVPSALPGVHPGTACRSGEALLRGAPESQGSTPVREGSSTPTSGPTPGDGGHGSLVPYAEIAAPSRGTGNWDTFHCELSAGCAEFSAGSGSSNAGRASHCSADPHLCLRIRFTTWLSLTSRP